MLRHLGEVQGAGRADDLLLVHRQAREVDMGRSAGKHDMLGRIGLGVLLALYFDLAGAFQAATSLEPVDLVLLEEKLDPLHVGLDHPVLVTEHRRQIQLHPADLDAEVGKGVVGLLELFARLQQGFRGDAADVQTGSPQRRAGLHAGRFQPQLRGPDGADVTARPRADNDDVVVVGAGLVAHWRSFVDSEDKRSVGLGRGLSAPAAHHAAKAMQRQGNAVSPRLRGAKEDESARVSCGPRRS